jgi:hypothetical protein
MIEVSGGCLLRSHRLGEFRQQTSSSTEKRAAAAGSRDRSFTEGEPCGAVPIDPNESRDAAAGDITRPGRWIRQLGHRAGVRIGAAVRPVLTQFFPPFSAQPPNPIVPDPSVRCFFPAARGESPPPPPVTPPPPCAPPSPGTPLVSRYRLKKSSPAFRSSSDCASGFIFE